MYSVVEQSKFGKGMETVDIHWRRFLEKGDKFSFSVIYEKYVDELYSYGISLGVQKEVCKDALQDTFYKLYIARERLHHVENITAYLFKTFKHCLINLSKKERYGEKFESLPSAFEIHVTVLDDIINDEKIELIKKNVELLLNKLTPNQREVVYLKYMNGLQHSEIAEVLNINEESARKLLYRAMERLRKYASEDNLQDRLLLFCLFSLMRL